MEKLFTKSRIKTRSIPLDFKRYLLPNINRKNRLIGIIGARGVGKTTLLLQMVAEGEETQSLYVSLDDLFFTENTLYGLAEQFYQVGGKRLFLDEVHKYPNWSRELKLIYDDFPDLYTIFTSSSILDIYKGESDLSRRAITYPLKPLSLRESLSFFEGIELPIYSVQELVENHEEIALAITKDIRPLQHYKAYLKKGAFPFYAGNKDEYYQQLMRTINLTLEVDLPSIQNVDYQNITKIKRLLYVLAKNVPFTPNISKLSKQVDLPRNALVQVLQWLSRAHLIHAGMKSGKSVSLLNKPDKIWLNNTNLSYAIAAKEPDVGNLRETFFLSQLSGNHEISIPLKGDFYVDETYTFEIGGKNKKSKQVLGIENAFLVKDDIEVGALKSIPLWLFGLLY